MALPGVLPSWIYRCVSVCVHEIVCVNVCMYKNLHLSYKYVHNLFELIPQIILCSDSVVLQQQPQPTAAVRIPPELAQVGSISTGRAGFSFNPLFNPRAC